MRLSRWAMLPVDAYLKGIAAIVSLVLAVVTLLARRQRGAIPLSAFFALLAVNQGAEAVRAVVAGPVDELRWARAAAVAASLDPFALAWAVASVVPAVVRRGWEPWTLALLCAASALYAGWVMPEVPGVPASSHVFPFLLTTLTAIVYVGLLVRVARAIEARDAKPAHRALFAGLVIAAVPAAIRPVEQGFAVVEPTLRPLGLSYLPLVLGSAALLLVVFRHGIRGETLRAARLAALAGVLLALVARIPHLVTYASQLLGGGEAPELLSVAGRLEVPVRWLLFGSLASVAVLGADLLGVEAATRRRAARLLVGLATLVVAGGALAFAATALDASPLDAFYLLVLLSVLALSQWTRRFLDATATRLYGPRAGRATERFRVERPLADRGGVRAYVATDELLARRVMLVELPTQPDGVAPSMLAQARRIGAVTHPNVLVVHDVLQRPKGWTLVAELAEGGTLADALRDGRLTPASRAHIADGLKAAVQALQARDVTHGDLRAESVLLSVDLTPKVAGFAVGVVAPRSEARSDEAALAELLQALDLDAASQRI